MLQSIEIALCFFSRPVDTQNPYFLADKLLNLRWIFLMLHVPLNFNKRSRQIAGVAAKEDLRAVQ